MGSRLGDGAVCHQSGADKRSRGMSRCLKGSSLRLESDNTIRLQFRRETREESGCYSDASGPGALCSQSAYIYGSIDEKRVSVNPHHRSRSGPKGFSRICRPLLNRLRVFDKTVALYMRKVTSIGRKSKAIMEKKKRKRKDRTACLP